MLVRMQLKWLQDRRCLPLTTAHRELYDIVHRLCLRELERFPNLVNCPDYNDRIQWLKLFDQSRDIIRCSDKILARDYVKEHVGEQYLVKLYQVHNHYDQIDFDALPDSFVIKTNHDSGTVILVRDKTELDHQAAKAKIEKALKNPYGWLNGEWAYLYITPKVFVEQFIITEDQKPPPDYKFHCADGKVRCLQYISDRGSVTKESIVQLDGKVTSTHFDHNMLHIEEFTVPTTWESMMSVAESLATPFKYVRVDMYSTNQNVYVGEMTFFPMAGCYKGEGQKKIGQLLDFDRTTYKPLLLPELEEERRRFMEKKCKV